MRWKPACSSWKKRGSGEPSGSPEAGAPADDRDRASRLSEPLAQVKRMHQWVLEVEHILDGSGAQTGEEVSNATVGKRLDAWRERMACS